MASRVWIGIFLLSCLALGACGGSPTAPSVPFRQLRTVSPWGPFSCQQGVRVVRDAAEWNTLAAGLQFVEPPAIDFATEMVLIVSLGTRPTSGYSVEISAVRSTGNQLSIEAVEFTPDNCVVLQVVTCPGAMVVVPRTDASVDIEWGMPRPHPGCS